MVLIGWPRLASLLLVLAGILPASDRASATTHLSAYADRRGDMAMWQVCDLRPGINATFSPNPSYGLPNQHGIIADRARLTLRVTASVPPGNYRLVFLSYSYIHGPVAPLVIEYVPHLRVLLDHSIRFPGFNHWGGVDATDPHAVLPQSPCTRLPDTSS